jgi:hypothetical protein
MEEFLVEFARVIAAEETFVPSGRIQYGDFKQLNPMSLTDS